MEDFNGMTEKANEPGIKQEPKQMDDSQTVNIYGEDFTLQRMPSSQWLLLKRRCKTKRGDLDELKLIEELLEHIVVSPRITMDDRPWAVVNKITSAAIDFMNDDEIGF